MIPEWSHLHPDPSRSQWPFLIWCSMKLFMFNRSTPRPAGSANPARGCKALFYSFSTVYPFMCLYNFLSYIYLFEIVFKRISRLKETLKVSEFWNCRNFPSHTKGVFFVFFFPINPLQVLVQHLLDYLQFHHCTHLSGSSCHSQVALNIFVQRTKGTMHLVIIFELFSPQHVWPLQMYLLLW